MDQLLSGQKIVIIGGTTGIGFSATKAFLRSGAQVLATGLSTMGLPVLDGCTFLAADAREEGSAEKAINTCVSTFGDFHALYHVAGGSGRKWGDGPLHELSLDGWNKTIELNLTSMMLSNRAAIRYFLDKKKAGVILNTSSVLASHPSAKFFYTHAYAAAKAAIIGYSKSIAAYYAPHDIRVNVLSPALTHTPMAERAAGRPDIQHFIRSKQPLDGGRMAKASDLDLAACYFLSPLSPFTTGQVLAVDGGWSVSEGQWPEE